MKSKFSLVVFAHMLAAFIGATAAQASAAGDTESPEQHDARMAWGHEARFGRFIHPEVSSLPAIAPDAIASGVCAETSDPLPRVQPAVVPGAEPGATVKAALSPLREDSRLPRVMIIGDSISVGYTDGVRDLLAAKANVHRVQGNAGPSSSGVQKVDEWIAPASGKWDVIHFNFGLHDVKLGTGGKDNRPYATADGRQVPADEYERNLRLIVARLKTTGATLIWASTTPIPTGKLDPLRRPGDEVKYNEIARKVMTVNGVAIDDLYSVITTGKPGLQQPANVHFTKEGSALLAQQVAQSIQAALQRRAQ